MSENGWMAFWALLTFIAGMFVGICLMANAWRDSVKDDIKAGHSIWRGQLYRFEPAKP